MGWPQPATKQVPTRVEWHRQALEDLKRLDVKVQERIRRSVADLKLLDDARLRLAPYAENLRGYWKLRVGDYRLVCQLQRDDRGHAVLVVHVVNRREAYLARSIKTIKRRSED